MEIEIVDVVPRSIVYLTRTTSSEPEDIEAAMHECQEALFGLLSEQRIRPLGAPVAIFDKRAPDATTFRTGFPVADADTRLMSESALCGTTPGGRAARVVHRGDYGEVPGILESLRGHVETHDYVSSGPSWEVHLSEGSGPEDASAETEIYLPIAEKRAVA